MHYAYLKRAIADVRENSPEHVSALRFNREFIQRRYSTDVVYDKWINMLEEVNQAYPTVESRAFPKQMFVYRTT